VGHGAAVLMRSRRVLFMNSADGRFSTLSVSMPVIRASSIGCHLACDGAMTASRAMT
jgi:hypothetical protein